MKRNRINKIFTLFLLLYFVGFAVSPVSAMFPADQLEKDGPRDLLKKNTTQADLFFFDLALWEVLKKSKRSDKPFSLALIEKSASNAKDIDAKVCDSASHGIDSLKLHLESTQLSSESYSASDRNPRLAHSGLSPPFSS